VQNSDMTNFWFRTLAPAMVVAQYGGLAGSRVERAQSQPIR
jgi:hypothetical protein